MSLAFEQLNESKHNQVIRAGGKRKVYKAWIIITMADLINTVTRNRIPFTRQALVEKNKA
jgi:hypothetical protein